jgi:hypothetical protein
VGEVGLFFLGGHAGAVWAGRIGRRLGVAGKRVIIFAT